jgi:hypothetical protein
MITKWDSVDSMKLLTKILKKRKAMTPLMIGLIVAASVIAVVFIVMAAVIPTIDNNLVMHIRDDSVRAVSNETIDVALRLRMICDYQDGMIYKAEVYNTNTSELYGTYALNRTLARQTESEVIIPYFNASAAAITAGHFVNEANYTNVLKFMNGAEYQLKIFYRSMDSKVDTFDIETFVYEEI